MHHHHHVDQIKVSVTGNYTALRSEYLRNMLRKCSRWTVGKRLPTDAEIARYFENRAKFLGQGAWTRSKHSKRKFYATLNYQGVRLELIARMN